MQNSIQNGTFLAQTTKQHWEQVYQNKQPESVSWYTPHLDQSLDLIQRLAQPAQSTIIDIGCGACMLVDDLLQAGYCQLAALDIAPSAIGLIQKRLGVQARQVRWYTGDITQMALPENAFDLWHDRAVFHFLRQAKQRQAYIGRMYSALRHGGYTVLAAFAANGPQKCSGLQVVRYTPEQLQQTLGPAFTLLDASQHVHHTPWGSEQTFLYCCLRLQKPFNASAE